MKGKIKIKFDREGTVEIKTEGIEKNNCFEYIKLFENTFSGKTINSAFTDEYYKNKKN